MGSRHSTGIGSITWQTVVGEVISLPEIQQPFPIPVREDVPMEEREARANRYARLVAGRTEQERHPSSSKVVPLLPRQVARLHRRLEEAFLPGALDPVDSRTAGVGRLDPRNDPTNPLHSL